MATLEFFATNGSHDNFCVKIEISSAASWRIESENAECPFLVSGVPVVETRGNLACRHTGTEIVVLNGASFDSVEGTTGTARVPESSHSEAGCSIELMADPLLAPIGLHSC